MQRLRRWGTQLDYRIEKSRRGEDLNNAGQYQVINSYSNTVVYGLNYDAAPDDVVWFLNDQDDEAKRDMTAVETRPGVWAVSHTMRKGLSHAA